MADESVQSSCFCWSWKKLPPGYKVKAFGSENNPRRIESTLVAIKVARDSVSMGSNDRYYPSNMSSASTAEQELLHVNMEGEISASAPSAPASPSNANAKGPRKQEFVWVDIDSEALDKLPKNLVQSALEERNRAFEASSPRTRKAQKEVLPVLEWKLSTRAHAVEAGFMSKTMAMNDEDPAVIEWNPAGWDDPEIVCRDPDLVNPRPRKKSSIKPPRNDSAVRRESVRTPKGSARTPRGSVLQSFAASWSNTLRRKSLSVRAWRQPKFSNTAPTVGSRHRDEDEAAFLSARDDDVKVGQGTALLKPSDIRKKTPRGKKEASKANWGDCPLTMDTIKVPVRAGDGKVYERWAIEKWLLENANRSPLTNVIIDPKLTPLSNEGPEEEQSVTVAAGNFGLEEEEEECVVELRNWSAVRPFLLDELRHLDGSVLSLVKLAIPCGTRKGTQVAFEWKGETVRTVYKGPVYKQEHVALFALVESEVGAGDLSVQGGDVPGGLSGMRKRMEMLGHSFGTKVESTDVNVQHADVNVAMAPTAIA